MARRVGKLPASSDGLAAQLMRLGEYLEGGEKLPPICTLDWQRIGSAYGMPLPVDVRDAIVGATEFFVLSERSDRTGPPVASVRKMIENCKRRASEFQAALPSPESDDALHAIAFIAKNYNDALLKFVALQGFLTSFQLACDAGLEELSDFPALKEGEAWSLWIRRLNRIMEDNGLPAGVRKDVGGKSKSDKSSPFTLLVKELQSCLPAECRRHMHSLGALATAISLALGSNKLAAPRK